MEGNTFVKVYFICSTERWAIWISTIY